MEIIEQVAEPLFWRVHLQRAEAVTGFGDAIHTDIELNTIWEEDRYHPLLTL